MADCTVTLSANAGVSLLLGGTRILIDALHDASIPGFSSIRGRMWDDLRQSQAFSDPAAICYTHCHRDHYSRALSEAASALWPAARLILPQAEFPRQILLNGPEVYQQIGSLTVYFFRLTHEKAVHAAVPHYGMLISSGTFRVLLAGDCEPGDPALLNKLRRIPVDLAILNFPWITLQKGRTALESNLRPKHLMIFHLPFQQDDRWGYRRAAAKAAELTRLPDIRILDRPFQTETV